MLEISKMKKTTASFLILLLASLIGLAVCFVKISALERRIAALSVSEKSISQLSVLEKRISALEKKTALRVIPVE
jgi:hypothetical protein